MRSDGEATKNRILLAAAVEFAEFGLAGARVDRIAAAASASKERLYAYFGDKRALFAAVLADHIQEVTTVVPMTADDLPGFVGAMFDFTSAHPEHFRMLDWARLGGDFELLPAIPPSVIERDAAAIRAAQKAGLIDPAWHPADLFELLFSIAISHAQVAGISSHAHPSTTDTARRRAAAVRAAAKLIAL